MVDQHALSQQCIALAALFQSLQQVQACARDGEPSDVQAMRVVLASTLRLDAPSVIGVYGDLRDLRPGLELLAYHLARQLDAARLEQARYANCLMSLERQLMTSPALSRPLAHTLGELKAEREDRAIDNPWVVQRLANAYSQHISRLSPRVMVSGEPVHLKTADNADRIRALLLAGLRAAVLWRQCKGSQLKSLLFRGSMQRAVVELMDRA